MSGQQRDWSAIRLRLEALGENLLHGSQPTREEIDRVYRRRAAELARPLAQSGEERTENILVFRAGAARFGVLLTHIAEVLPHPKIARVPGAPAEIAGLVQVRGEVRQVWNLQALLGWKAPESAPYKAEHILLLRHAAQEIGVAAESIEDIVAHDPEKLQPSTANLPGIRVTDDHVTVFDVKILFERLQNSPTL